MTPPPPSPASGTPRHRGPSLARRALPALVLSGASGLLLSVLDRPGASVGATGTDETGVATAAPGTVSIVSTPTAVTAPATTTPSATAAPAPATAPATAPGETAPAATAPATTLPAVATTVPAAPVCTTIDGPTVETRWGPVQVEASVTPNGQICSVDAIQTPSDRSKSVAINRRAVPVLDQSALAAQSTAFNGVSGATVTSRGYKQSLQAILDSLG